MCHSDHHLRTLNCGPFAGAYGFGRGSALGCKVNARYATVSGLDNINTNITCAITLSYPENRGLIEAGLSSHDKLGGKISKTADMIRW